MKKESEGKSRRARRKSVRVKWQTEDENGDAFLAIPAKLTRLKRGDLIGAGTFAAVFDCSLESVTCSSSKLPREDLPQNLAWKTTRMNNSGCREVAVLQRNGPHPNVTRFLAHFRSSEEGEFFANSIFQRIQKNLFDELRANDAKPFSRQRLFKIAGQLFKGLAHVHSKRIVHADVKPSNLLLTEDDQLKICDFGNAKSLDEEIHSPICSAFYRAPEVLLARSELIGEKADIWAAGCVVAEMAAKSREKVLFRNESDVGVVIEIICLLGPLTTRESSMLDPEEILLTPNNREVLSKIVDLEESTTTINQNLARRLDQSETADVVTLLSRILRYLPEERPFAEELSTLCGQMICK